MSKKLIIFAGPSAVGKATIEKELFKDKSLKLCLSVSATTRKPREGEKEGTHYYFIEYDHFNEKIRKNQFAEWNEHFNNKYGTPDSEIDRINNLGLIPFLELDVIGAKQIIEKYGNDNIVSIFISPPSIEALKERILARGTETPEQIEKRLSRVEKEMKAMSDFQFIVINDDINKAVNEVKEILRREI